MEDKEKFVIFGSGKFAQKVWHNYKEKIIAVIDNDVNKQGTMFLDEVPIISLQEYLKSYNNIEIIIAIKSTLFLDEVIKQLMNLNINKFHLAPGIPGIKEEFAEVKDIRHSEWQEYIINNFDKSGFKILEIGSRNVTGSLFGKTFKHAYYIGFDYYPGENVDIVGDAHRLSEYFGNQKFDLIFSSAVFEHLAMPWKVSTEIIKTLKGGGYVFIETHYCFNSHQRPWHFFQFSENALNVLFPEKFGIKWIKKGVSNLISSKFSEVFSDKYLRGKPINNMWCHSEFLGQKVREVENLSWDNCSVEDVVGETKYPTPSVNQ